MRPPHLQEAGRLPENLSDEQRDWVRELVALHLEKMSYAAEIVELTELFFKDEIGYNEEANEVLNDEQVPEVLNAFKEKVDNMEDFSAEQLKKSMKEVQKETGHKGKKLFMPIRVAATGQTHGPDLPKTLFLLGRQKVSDRLGKLLK